MIRGIYAAASAMLAGMTTQGLKAHNAANVDTPGFKQVITSFEEFTKVLHQRSVVDPLMGQAYIDQMLPQGIDTIPIQTDFGQGPLRATNEPLDFAITGAGFFRIETPDGERYTRDGRFLVDAEGQLVTVDGHYVLNDSGEPIDLPVGEVTAAADGGLYVDGELADRLGVAAFDDPGSELVRDTPNAFSATGEPAGEEIGTIQQGYLEMANVNAVKLMTGAKTYEAAQRTLQMQDELLGRAIQALGKF